jgi:predicted permease
MSTSSTSSQSSLLQNAHFRAMQLAIFLVGLAAMIVSGWYLIEGMLHFAGDDTSKRVFIAAGIIFQITESICFISAAALSNKHFYWRVLLLLLGCVLFVFSITVMTLAQKATLHSGEMETAALNEQIVATKSQIASLDEMIAAYRLNAEKQSQSIYANSRELGQDSLNRATELEEKKLALSEKLFTLSSARKQTSSDFFQQLETIVNYPALQMEFYFLVTRSLLLELCGIFLLSFAAYLKLPKHLPAMETIGDDIKFRRTANRQQAIFTRNMQNDPASSLVTSGHWASSHIQSLKRKSQSQEN